MISIEATGVGIAPERLANLCDAFVTTKSRGTGLGLGICRMIVDRHEGQLSATSELNRGTRFDITLPVVAVNGIRNRGSRQVCGDELACLRDQRERDRDPQRPLVRAQEPE